MVAIITTPDRNGVQSNLAFDGSALYYGDCSAIMRLRFYEQANAEVVLAISECARLVATNDARIFWANFGDALFQAPKSGGDSMPIFSGSRVTCIVADQSEVYWATVSGEIMREQIGGSPVSLGSTSAHEGCSMVLDANDLYWVSAGDNRIVRIHRITAEQRVFASGQMNVRDVAVDDSSVYWASAGNFDIQLEDYVDGAIWRMPKDGSTAPRRIASQRDPFGIVLTERHIYWSTSPHQELGGIFRRLK